MFDKVIVGVGVGLLIGYLVTRKGKKKKTKLGRCDPDAIDVWAAGRNLTGTAVATREEVRQQAAPAEGAATFIVVLGECRIYTWNGAVWATNEPLTKDLRSHLGIERME